MDYPLENERARVQELERALLALPTVADCALVPRPIAGRAAGYALFLVTTSAGQEQRAVTAVPELNALDPWVVSMQALPYTADGNVDRAELERLGLAHAGSASHAASALRSLPNVEHAAVLVEPTLASPRRWHVSKLVRDARNAEDSTGNEVQAEVAVAVNASTQLALVQTPSLQLPPDAPTTLGPALVRAATKYSVPRITYVADSGEESTQTFAQLLEEAERTLHGLRARGLQPGAYVIFQLEAPRNIIPTFWACLLGGFVPVVCPLPATYDGASTDLDKLLHVWRLLDQPLLVTEAARQSQLPGLLQHLGGSPDSIPVVERLREQPRDGRHHVAAPNDVAFLSLTSGSTGTPKCIALSHGNILSRGRGTNLLCDHDDSDVILNWLPFDHIGSISDWHLRCVDLGCRMIYCSKERVLGNPLNWLELIARFRITHSWAPNFAYALINSALDGAADQRWDLSCMKSLLTAGEAVSSATVEEFLTRLASFGLARSAVRAAFGMAELGSGITYFRPTPQQPYAALYVDRQSLTGTLRPLPPGHPRSIAFTGLGTVIAGMAMRIVDDQGALVPENTIGNLHVKGEAVTQGYVKNPEANTKVFVGDGWFDTGDRGFIADGQLFLTGRSKETIIVNGANYYPGELESAAEQAPGVLVSFTGACSVRPKGARAERVALFLSTGLLPPLRQADVLRDVQARVSKKIGLKPDYLIPLGPNQIPKTAIGKIQRKELARRFEEGEFDSIVENVDCLLENDNTLPNWFMRPVWRTTSVREGQSVAGRDFLVLDDSAGLAQAVCENLSRAGATFLRLSAGPEFRRDSDTHWTLDKSRPDQVSALCAALVSEGKVRSGLLDLSGYAAAGSAVESKQALLDSLQRECFGTLTLLQGLHRTGVLPKRCWVFASSTQPIGAADQWVGARALVVPMLQALEQGVEGFVFRHIDLPFANPAPAQTVSNVVAELSALGKEQEIAYRETRLTKGLELVDWSTVVRQPHPVLDEGAAAGFCLVTGGLGGLGVQVAKLLLARGFAVLLIGRSAPSERLSELERLGRVIYRQADVTDEAQVDLAVGAASAEFGCDLAGVVHLAGSAQETLILDETVASLQRVLAPKVIGGWVLDRLLSRFPHAFCVLFSSAATTVGTSMTGAYAMANAYLDGLASVQSAHGRLTQCFNWSPWEGVGMNASASSNAALRAKGLESIALRAGISSLLAGLGIAGPRLIVGLNPNHARIASWLRRPSQTQRLVGYFSRTQGADDVTFPATCSAQDGAGGTAIAVLCELSRLPIDASGQPDLGALQALVSGTAREKKLPRTDAERKLAAVFASVLGVDSVGVNEGFFDLGGTSLLSLRLFGEIERAFGVRLPAATLLEAASVEQIAARLETPTKSNPQDCLVQITPPHDGPAMFLVHDADGETILYRNLAQALNGTAVYGLQPYGNERFPALHTSIEEMSEHYVRRVREVQPEGPYMLGGMCAGGVIAFEMACKLQSMGEQVALVVLLDAADARAPRIGATSARASRFAALFGGEQRDLRASLLAAGRKVKNLVEHETRRRFVQARNRAKLVLLRELRRRNATLPSLLQDISPRAVYEFAQAKYEPGTFSGKLLLLRATQADPRQEAQGFTDTPASQTTSDELLGWGRRSTSGVDVVDVPGGHSSMLQDPNVEVLGQVLRARIRQALGT